MGSLEEQEWKGRRERSVAERGSGKKEGKGS